MTRDKPTYSDPKLLLERLRTTFLCCSSFMLAAIGSLIKAHRFKMRLEVSGGGNPGYDQFVQVARHIGVEIAPTTVHGRSDAEYLNWAFDHSTKNLRAWIPTIEHRVGDYHVWLPFCFEHHVRRLREHAPDFAMPRVDNLYLLLIWSECFSGMKIPISARILQDLITWESFGEISANRFSGSLQDEVRLAHGQVFALNRPTQAYLGFCGGSNGLELCQKSGLEKHPFNAHTWEILNATQPIGGARVSAPPWLIQRHLWNADETAVILRNAQKLSTKHQDNARSSEDIEKVAACLKHRLAGLSEDEIAVQIEFSDRPEYNQWLIDCALDTDNSRHRRPYDRWLEACADFDLEPSDSLVDDLTCRNVTAVGSNQLYSSDADPAATQSEGPLDPLPGFRHSPDFRSVALPNGRTITLTDRQAQVVQLLYQNLASGTPELSQAYIINEVYPGVSENRLKRLFDDNEVFDVLIEPGSKKGVVRLKKSFE